MEKLQLLVRSDLDGVLSREVTRIFVVVGLVQVGATVT
jgi:hypothetical protein